MNQIKTIQDINEILSGMKEYPPIAQESDGAPRLLLPSPINPASILKIWDNFGYIRKSKKGYYAHAGIDITVAGNTPIAAPATCQLVKKYMDHSAYGHRGEYKILEGVATGRHFSISHCDYLPRSISEIITQGGLLGKSGSTGNSTGPHLHLEIGNNLGFNGYAKSPENVLLSGLYNPLDEFDFSIQA